MEVSEWGRTLGRVVAGTWSEGQCFVAHVWLASAMSQTVTSHIVTPQFKQCTLVVLNATECKVVYLQCSHDAQLWVYSHDTIVGALVGNRVSLTMQSLPNRFASALWACTHLWYLASASETSAVHALTSNSCSDTCHPHWLDGVADTCTHWFACTPLHICRLRVYRQTVHRYSESSTAIATIESTHPLRILSATIMRIQPSICFGRVGCLIELWHATVPHFISDILSERIFDTCRVVIQKHVFEVPVGCEHWSDCTYVGIDSLRAQIGSEANEWNV